MESQVTAYSLLGAANSQRGDNSVLGSHVHEDIAKAKGKGTVRVRYDCFVLYMHLSILSHPIPLVQNLDIFYCSLTEDRTRLAISALRSLHGCVRSCCSPKWGAGGFLLFDVGQTNIGRALAQHILGRPMGRLGLSASLLEWDGVNQLGARPKRVLGASLSSPTGLALRGTSGKKTARF